MSILVTKSIVILSVDALLEIMDEADATLAVVRPVDRDLAKPPGVWPRPATGPATAGAATGAESGATSRACRWQGLLQAGGHPFDVVDSPSKACSDAIPVM